MSNYNSALGYENQSNQIKKLKCKTLAQQATLSCILTSISRWGRTLNCILNSLLHVTHGKAYFSEHETVWVLILHRDGVPLYKIAYHLIGGGCLGHGQRLEVDLGV